MKIWIHNLIAERAQTERDNLIVAERDCALEECIRSVGGDRLYELLVDETNGLRPHINIFVDSAKTRDISQKVSPNAEIHIFPALSGG